MRIMYQVIVSGTVMAALFFSINVSASSVKLLTESGGMLVAVHVFAHPPVTGDCASCHPDVRTMPRIN